MGTRGISSSRFKTKTYRHTASIHNVNGQGGVNICEQSTIGGNDGIHVPKGHGTSTLSESNGSAEIISHKYSFSSIPFSLRFSRAVISVKSRNASRSQNSVTLFNALGITRARTPSSAKTCNEFHKLRRGHTSHGATTK